MKFMVIVRATEASEAGAVPSPEMFEAMGRFNQELIDNGVMRLGDGLKPSSHGARVHFDGAQRDVTRGPFPVNEVVAGFWLWETSSLDEAIAWAKRCPNPMPGPSSLEIRPFFEMADFGEAMTPELRQQEDDQRRQLGDA